MLTRFETNQVRQVKALGEVKAIGEIEIIQEGNPQNRSSVFSFLCDTTAFVREFTDKLSSAISPTVIAQEQQQREIRTENTKSDSLAPSSGENITKSLGTLPAGEQITVQFTATLNSSPSTFHSVSNTAAITADGGVNINSSTATNAVVQPA